MEALRDLADDFNVRDPRKLYRLARQRDLDVTQAMAFEALKADVGRQVQAPRPRALGKSAAEGPNDRLQADLIDFSQNTRGEDEVRPGGDGRLHPGGPPWEPLQNKNAETVGRATKRAARELTGDDGNFVVTTDLGNEFATLGPGAARKCRAPHEAARGPQRHRRGGPGHPDAEEGPGHEGGAARAGSGGDHFQQTASAYNARPHETVHGAPEDVEKQPATEFRVLQDNADKFQHNKDLTERRVKAVEDAGAFRAPTNAARSFNPQYGDVQRLGAVDSMTVRSTEGRETAEAGAAGAATQRQRGGPADETQAGGL